MRDASLFVGGAKPPFGTPINWEHPLSRGLVAAWLLNEGHGGRAVDTSGGGCDLVYDGAATNQISWQGTVMNTNNDFGRVFGPSPFLQGNPHRLVSPVNYPRLSAFTEAVTVELWWWPDTDTQANPVPVSHGPVNTRFLFVKSGADMAWRINGTGSDSVDTGVFSPNPARRWIHFVGTYDRVNQIIYRDGIVRATTAKTAAIAAQPTGVMAIGDAVGSTNWANGNIGLVRIWDRALSADEVVQLFNDPFGMYGSDPHHIATAADLSRDALIPVDSAGLVELMADALIPVDSVGWLSRDALIPVDSIGWRARDAVIPVDSTGVDPFSLPHTWNVRRLFEASLFHEWDVLNNLLTVSLQHDWRVISQAFGQSLPHSWKVIPNIPGTFGINPDGSPVTGTSADIQCPVAEIEIT